MKQTLARAALLSMLAAALVAHSGLVFAQSEQGHDPSAATTQQVGDLSFEVASLRVGPAKGHTPRHTGVTATIRIRNNGTSPVALNYKRRSYNVTDSRGYGYALYREHYTGVAGVTGMAVSDEKRADTSGVLRPGQTQNVTFFAVRYMRDGETTGETFDINTTFSSFEDMGQGRIRRINDFPVAFIGVRPQGQVQGVVNDAINEGAGRVLDRLLRGK